MTDLWSVLQSRVRRDAGRPLVTSIDAIQGTRVELSGASLANAAAKIANALRDEFELEPGASVGVDLPLHWQRSAWSAGAWTAGCLVVLDPQPDAVDLFVTSTDGAAAAAGHATSEVAVVSLHPFGLPIDEPLPPGCIDVTLAVRQQPDAYLFDPPTGALPALASATDVLTQSEVLTAAQERAAAWGVGTGGTLLATDALGSWDACLAGLPVPLVTDGSVVLLIGATDLARVERDERITTRAG